MGDHRDEVPIGGRCHRCIKSAHDMEMRMLTTSPRPNPCRRRGCSKCDRQGSHRRGRRITEGDARQCHHRAYEYCPVLYPAVFRG